MAPIRAHVPVLGHFIPLKTSRLLFACVVFLGAVLFVASFEADATEGLHYMHGAGIIHCDHKLQNVLICRSSTPMGFIGKVTDPGVWYGESGFGSGGGLSGLKKTKCAKSPRDLSMFNTTSTAPALRRRIVNT